MPCILQAVAYYTIFSILHAVQCGKVSNYSAVHISETPLRKLACLMFAASFLLPMLVKGGKVIYQCKGYLFSISSGIHF